MNLIKTVAKPDWKGFLLRIILPSIVAVFLFALSVFFILIPAFKKKIMDEKKLMIKELTDTAWSILEESYRQEKQGLITHEEAQKRAIERIRDLRYGDEHKDYFWITDMSPRMVAHPYLPDLNGRDLSDYSDPTGKRLFVNFVKLVETEGHGYLEYMWQWKDDPKRIVPKLSYVKGFKPWGWIIGTGVYIQDVEQEITAMTNRLLGISLVILILIAALMFFSTRESLKIERSRSVAEESLKESREKYRMLAEASTEGLIMVIERKYFYSNSTVRDMLGYSEEELAELDLNSLISEGDHPEAAKYFSELIDAEEGAPIQYEASLKTKAGELIEVLLTSSKISLSGKDGIVLIVKDVSGRRQIEQKRIEQERDNLIVELQTALLFLNQPIKDYFREPVYCDMNSSIRDAAEIMKKANCSSILVKAESGDFIGIITDSDMSFRAIASGHQTDRPVYDIMSSPIISIPEHAQMFEAAMIMQERNIRHLAVRDTGMKITGLISNKELLQVQRYSSASLVKEINTASSVRELIGCHERMLCLVKALIDSGARPASVTRIITTVSDLILNKLIGFAIDSLGMPPVSFAFMTLGSEGRGEETLVTDQDNAIIYENPPESLKAEADGYFRELGEKVCKWLDEIGYTFCKGDVMAMNPQWCCSTLRWESHFTKWLNTAEAQDLLQFNIFFDFRCSYGDKELVEKLRESIDEQLKNNAPFFGYLAENCMHYKPPLGLFGNISLKTRGEHAETFNIKEALKPIVNFARIYSLKNNISAANTLERFDQLFEKEAISESTHNEIVQVYDYLMQIRFKHQSAMISAKQEPDNHVNPSELSSIELEMLKKVFSQISAFQSKISYDFKGGA